jgi:hypothetical protein
MHDCGLAKGANMPTKRALIIGINTYPYMEEKYQLKGCENDARLMHSVLVNKFNFAPENIILLLSEHATRAAILAAMESIETSLEADDIFVFHFSGHGADCYVHEAFTDEGSGKDNCILACDDSEVGPDGKKIFREIRDHQFSDYLARIAQKTPYTTVIFDACYSGTMTRSAAIGDVAKDRFIPAVTRQSTNTSERSTANLQSGTGTLQQQARPIRGAGGWLTRSDSYTVISASRDTQKAKEWHFDVGGGSVRHGLLSFFLARGLMRAKSLATYRDVFEGVCAGVVSMVTEQHPQIEGRVDREVFGVNEIEPLDFVPVISLSGDMLTLGGGAAQGLTPGASYKVYPKGNKTAEEVDCLGIARVVSVEGLSSQAKLTEQRADIEVGARCVEFESAKAAEPLSINVKDLVEPHKALLSSKIKQSKLLKAVDSSKGAQLHARICDSKEQLEEWAGEDLLHFAKNEQNEVLDFPLWLMFEQQGSLAMRLRSLADDNAPSIIVANLEKLAKFRNVMQLENPSSKLDVEFNLYRLNNEDDKELVNGGSSEFREHELMSLELKNKAAEDSVFFAVFWIGADKEIMHFYPRNRRCEELAAGQSIRIGNLQSKLSASLPRQHFNSTGSITWKVMFANRETDFGLLRQEGMRSANAPASLEALDIAFTGEAAPTHTEHEGDSVAVEQHWCAINRSVLLKKVGR